MKFLICCLFRRARTLLKPFTPVWQPCQPFSHMVTASHHLPSTLWSPNTITSSRQPWRPPSLRQPHPKSRHFRPKPAPSAHPSRPRPSISGARSAQTPNPKPEAVPARSSRFPEPEVESARFPGSWPLTTTRPRPFPER